MMPEERYGKLKEYLSEENPVLLNVIDEYRKLDQIAHKVGLMERDETYTSHISWWPMISVLGTFSAGKSTFINEYMGAPIQQSGNQAIDDKFTVICYGKSEEPVTLPGLALDADPRFPFYNISEEINKVDVGEGERVNLYLQLKSIQSPAIKGKILIDSPGFDADSQRDGILRITSHMVEMSDLVLIFFDARHPEPGAMRDTLEHLVSSTIAHRDANKVLYILNQIDTTAKEDNLEEVIASWQRALSKEGLVSGNFFSIYSENASEATENPALLERLRVKKDIDLARILERMDKVNVERAYRIIKSLDNFAREIKEKQIPQLRQELVGWRGRVLQTELVLLVLLLAIVGGVEVEFGILSKLEATGRMIAGGVLALLVVGVHFKVRGFFAQRLIEKWQEREVAMAKAIAHNTRWWRSLFGFGHNWHKGSKQRLAKLMGESKTTIQRLNDQFVVTAKEQKE